MTERKKLLRIEVIFNLQVTEHFFNADFSRHLFCKAKDADWFVRIPMWLQTTINTMYIHVNMHILTEYFLPNSFKFRVILSDFLYCTIISSSILYQTPRINILMARLPRLSNSNPPPTFKVAATKRSSQVIGQKCRLECRSLCYGE